MVRSAGRSLLVFGALFQVTALWGGDPGPAVGETEAALDSALGLFEQVRQAATSPVEASGRCSNQQGGVWPSCIPLRTPQSLRSRQAATKTRSKLASDLASVGLEFGAPVFLRAFKHADLDWSLSSLGGRMEGRTLPEKLAAQFRGGILEVWVYQYSTGKFVNFRTYNVCALEGGPGPKRNEGDYQTPEGFYAIGASAMNPNSSYYLSFDVGYANSYDKARRKSPQGAGGNIMVHGICATVGCLSMTDERVEEIYTLVDASLAANELVDPQGRTRPYEVQMQIFPFWLSPENIGRFSPAEIAQLSAKLVKTPEGKDAGLPLEVGAFWDNLREGMDWFEEKQVPPIVSVEGVGVNARYRFSEPVYKPRKRLCP